LFTHAVPDGEDNVVEESTSTGREDTTSSSRNVPERDGAASSSSVTSSVIITNRPPSSTNVEESSRSVASVQSVEVSTLTEAMAELPHVVSEKEAIDNLKKLTDHLAAMTVRDHVVSLRRNPWFEEMFIRKKRTSFIKNF
jgi:hypothetical protein